WTVLHVELVARALGGHAQLEGTVGRRHGLPIAVPSARAGRDAHVCARLAGWARHTTADRPHRENEVEIDRLRLTGHDLDLGEERMRVAALVGRVTIAPVFVGECLQCDLPWRD